MIFKKSHIYKKSILVSMETLTLCPASSVLSAASAVSFAYLSKWLCFPFDLLHVPFRLVPIFEKQLSVFNTMMLALKIPNNSF